MSSPRPVRPPWSAAVAITNDHPRHGRLRQYARHRCQPNRLAAAQAAAKAFVADQPSNVRIGVVSFAATASVVQTPTHNREDIVAAIDRFQLQRGTAIGSGIIVSLATIFPDARIDVSSLIYGRNPPRGVPLDQASKSDKPAFKPVPPGSYTSAAIILLTDGQRTTGPDSIEAAQMAADRGVRISPSASAPRGGNHGFRRLVDARPPGRRVAQDHRQHDPRPIFLCRHRQRLKKVYDSINPKFLLEKKAIEVSALFAAGPAARTGIRAAFNVVVPAHSIDCNLSMIREYREIKSALPLPIF